MSCGANPNFYVYVYVHDVSCKHWSVHTQSALLSPTLLGQLWPRPLKLVSEAHVTSARLLSVLQVFYGTPNYTDDCCNRGSLVPGPKKPSYACVEDRRSSTAAADTTRR